jgi:hypothetical protein
MKREKKDSTGEKEDRLLGFFGDRFHKNVFLICLTTSVGLLVASFVTPPMWIIDGSVLAAVGELFGFAALGEVAAAVERGHTATISHGNTSIEIRKEEEGNGQDGEAQ